ncbi:hypothetical protein F0562_003120 [Nyssa sinensis]|uniref:Uncharacterized protein n=1 Tax=Nyssa sinensis TaxID=561372 RepID=A0A5J5BUH8_9ASTE|nr:hypothetical protein F0562_003120 [Nyssa sinensis]
MAGAGSAGAVGEFDGWAGAVVMEARVSSGDGGPRWGMEVESVGVGGDCGGDRDGGGDGWQYGGDDDGSVGGAMMMVEVEMAVCGGAAKVEAATWGFGCDGGTVVVMVAVLMGVDGAAAMGDDGVGEHPRKLQTS